MSSLLSRLAFLTKSFSMYLFTHWLMFIPIHRVRKMFIRRSLQQLGSESNFLMGVEIRNGGNISVGNNCAINSRVLLDGRGGKLTIGNHVDIAQETNIWTLGHDVHDDYYASKGGDVTIEDYVWIASRVTVLPNVQIGRGAVIGTNSVVTKDVPAMAIMAGVPAQRIGTRKSALKYKFVYRPPFR